VITPGIVVETPTVCPICGCDCVHIGPVRVLQNDVETIVDRRADRVREKRNHGRGSVVTIDFYCESNCAFAYQFSFHKGTTTFRVIERNADDQFHFNELPAELDPSKVVALVDTREQLPLDLSPLQMESATLSTGDYTVRALEGIVAIERKSLSDLVGCIGVERERFEREMQRIIAYPCRALVIESSWPEIEAGEWRSRVTPAAVIGSLLGWSAAGVPLLLCGDHQRAGQFVSRMLYIAARRRWREARALVGAATDMEVAS
jgi:DNA excision repair protein ERCC-4